MTTEAVHVVALPHRLDPMSERARFAADLRTLRRAAGSPSYARLYRLSPLLPPATISGVLNARSTPRLEFVLAFVEAVRAHAEQIGVHLTPEQRDPETWRRRWLDLPVVRPSRQEESHTHAVRWLHEAHVLLADAADDLPHGELTRAALLLGAALDLLAVS